MRWNEYQTKTDPVSGTDELLIKDETDNVKRMPATSFKWDKGDKGDKWDKGDQWIQGETWPVWPQWPQGEQGIPWPAIDPQDIKREVENVLDEDQTITKAWNEFNWSEQLVKTNNKSKIEASNIPWALTLNKTLIDNTIYCMWWEEVINMSETTWVANITTTTDMNINIWTTQPMFVDYCEIETYWTVDPNIVMNCYKATWWASSNLVWSSVKTEIIDTWKASPEPGVNYKIVRFYFNFGHMALNTVKYVRLTYAVNNVSYTSIPASVLKWNRFLNGSNSAINQFFLKRLVLKKDLIDFQSNWSTWSPTFYKYYKLNTKKPGELFYYKDWYLQNQANFTTTDPNCIQGKYVLTDNHWVVSYSDTLTTTTFWYVPENGVIQPFYKMNPLFEYTEAWKEEQGGWWETKNYMELDWDFEIVWSNIQVWDLVWVNLKYYCGYQNNNALTYYALVKDQELVQKIYYKGWILKTIWVCFRTRTQNVACDVTIYDSNWNVIFTTNYVSPNSSSSNNTEYIGVQQSLWDIWEYYVAIKRTDSLTTNFNIAYSTSFINNDDACIRNWTTLTPNPVTYSWTKYKYMSICCNFEWEANKIYKFELEKVLATYYWVVSKIVWNWKYKICYLWEHFFNYDISSYTNWINLYLNNNNSTSIYYSNLTDVKSSSYQILWKKAWTKLIFILWS